MWVPVALSRDVPAGATRAVVIEGEERVIRRAADGTVQVWEDRCPHRGMRLSLGFVRGNTLNCLYHDWEYASGAHCQRIPAHPDLEVPNTIRARAFPVAEGGGMIWTRDAGQAALPSLPLGIPLISLAVEAPDEAVLKLCNAVPQGSAQIFAATMEGITLHIGWHAVSPLKTMLHAAVTEGTDLAAAVRALRSLRGLVEARIAA